ncbi:MAG TPA: tetratricopeptide repeat protein [Terriglobales bacterium]|nr:tetratricopeptide repeat protein [Terriglobales bacterium]
MHSSARSAAVASLLLFSILLVTGCSGSFSQDLLRAQEAERQGDPAGALRAYERALTKIRPRDQRVASTIRLRIGICQLRLAQPNEAFLNFQNAVLLDPQNLEAHRRMAELLLMGGATQKAADELHAILKKDPNDAGAIGTLGTAYATAGNVPAALQLLQRSFALNPADAQIAITLAELYNRENHVEDARKVLVQSGTRNPGEGDTWLALGRLEEQEGQPAAAESAYRSAVKADDSVRNNLRLAQFLQRAARLSEAEAILQRVDAKQPDSPPLLADFLLVSGRATAAAAVYASSLHQRVEDALVTRSIEARVAPSSEDPDRDVRAARQLLIQHLDQLDTGTRSILQAEIALRENDLPAAEAHARAAVAHDPTSVPALFVLGAALKYEGRKAEAKSAWQSALQADSTYVPTRLALAAESMEEGQWVTAEEHITPVVREEPANLQALVLYARVLEGQKRWEAAESIARRALQVDPNDPVIHTVLGNALIGKKQFAAALASYQRALGIDSQSIPALNGLLALYRKGTLTRASIVKMETVAAEPPASAALVEVAGRLYADRGFVPDAERALRKALELEPHRASAALALMQLSLQQRDSAAAAEFAPLALGRTQPALAQLIQGREAELRADRTRAIRHYESAVRLGESTGAAANNLAWIYAQQGVQLDRALELARRASELDPKNPAIWDTLGAVLLRRRDYTAAAEALTSARSLSEAAKVPIASRRQIYKHLAEAYIGAGLPERADEMNRRLRE